MADIEYGIRHFPTGEIVNGFESESAALLWLNDHPEFASDESETILRRKIWSMWEPVHKDST